MQVILVITFARKRNAVIICGRKINVIHKPVHKPQHIGFRVGRSAVDISVRERIKPGIFLQALVVKKGLPLMLLCNLIVTEFKPAKIPSILIAD